MADQSQPQSRSLSASATHQSIYQAIREHEHGDTHGVHDPDSPTALDEQNLMQPFHDQDLDGLLAEDEDPDSRLLSARSVTASASDAQAQQPPTQDLPLNLPPPPSAVEADADIPNTLLSEDPLTRPRSLPRSSHAHGRGLPAPVPGPSNPRSTPYTRNTEAARAFRPGRTMGADHLAKSMGGPLMADPAERAMWMWANVDNLDNFLAEVYGYFRGKGIWSILLARLFEQLTLAFVVGFGTFLTACVDYHEIPRQHKLSDVLVPRCTRNMSGISNLALWLISFYWIFKSVRLVLSAPRLWHMHCFFVHLLKVSEDELQTITWQAIVSRLMDLRDLNARTALNVTHSNRKFLGDFSKQRMDAHDIANRLMRKENYLIALFNKDILDLTLPIPILRNRPLFSQNLEWNINLCVIDFVFNDQGQVSQLFLKDSHRSELIEGLRRRFIIAGCINVVSAPFIVTYFLILYFLRYFTEFQRHPSRLGSRAYSPLAEWKFREFNELYHFFERRLNMSRPFASQYLDQFPKDKTTQVARFVAFVAGALAAVLAIATLLDPELFFNFEITHERTALFYLSLFGGIWAVARGMVPEEETVFDPEHAINNVAEFTHYKPSHWEGRLHSEDVRREFSGFYQMKIVIFLEEILSMVFTPFLLWFTLPRCSERLVDFFREFTIHVDGLGYVCSFALFEFSKGAPRLPDGPSSRKAQAEREDLREEYYATKDGKMLSSYYSFMDSYANNGRPPAPSLATNRARKERVAFRPTTASVYEQSTPKPAATGRDSMARSMRARHPVRLAQAASDASPSPSLLLDSRHQPSRPAVPRAEQRAVQTGRSPEAGASDEHVATGPVTSSALLDEDSNLGDSWKTTMAAESGGSGAGAGATANGAAGRAGNTSAQRAAGNDAPGAGTQAGDAGVLGLLYEFQRAQTEGRGAGVKM